MQSTLSFILVLGALVVIHEFGHYIVARLVGIRAEKFSIGFGPVIFGKKIGDTEFCVSILPLGGFVKLAGESPEEAKGAAWEFQSKSLLSRAAVVLAGPFMNALLAYVIFFFILLVGQPSLTSRIGKVLPDAPAAKAGFLENDKILEVDGKPVSIWEDVLKEVRQKKDSYKVRVERGTEALELTVNPETREVKDVFGKPIKSSFLGIAPSKEIIRIKSPLDKAWLLAWEKLWGLTSMIFVSLGLMITGALPFKDSMTGPIGIFFMTQQAAQMGLDYLLYFMGSLSVSLFVLNLLPIPVLDGGHLLFMIIEKIKGSPLKESIREKFTQGGMVALLALMGFVILQDVHRFSLLDNLLKLFQKA